MTREELLDAIEEKMDTVSDKNKGKIPYTTDKNGNYSDESKENTAWWTNGFWGGIMWLMYESTGKEKYKSYAMDCEKKLSRVVDEFYELHHDVGFMYMPTAVADWRLTGNKASRLLGLKAATTLMARFNVKGGYIRAWNDEWGDNKGWAIIDSMMNLSLLYWASEETKDPRYKHLAMAHADTLMKNFVREDGSVIHIGVFDPETGEFLKNLPGQGYDESSSWSRGQGWGLYGFTLSYEKTGKKEYLDTAVKIADYCLENIGPDGIVKLDFRQPEEPALEDSCAACIIASGLIELSKQVKGRKKSHYLERAVEMIKTIAQHRADWTTKCDAIVQNCSTAYHDTKNHITMSYADYFFIEAVYKLAGIASPMW